MCEWTVEAHEKREIVQEKVSEKVETQGRSFFFSDHQKFSDHINYKVIILIVVPWKPESECRVEKFP